MKRVSMFMLSCLLILLSVLVVLSGCAGETESPVLSDSPSSVDSVESMESTESPESAPAAEVTELGTGAVSFAFDVVFVDGSTAAYLIHTDREFVGEALLDNGLIAGDEGDFGLYVKTVAGVTVDFDTDGKYWAFYANDAYSLSGVDTTSIEEGVTYSFRAE